MPPDDPFAFTVTRVSFRMLTNPSGLFHTLVGENLFDRERVMANFRSISFPTLIGIIR
jgi:hypothetical protein